MVRIVYNSSSNRIVNVSIVTTCVLDRVDNPRAFSHLLQILKSALRIHSELIRKRGLIARIYCAIAHIASAFRAAFTKWQAPGSSIRSFLSLQDGAFIYGTYMYSKKGLILYTVRYC